MFTLSRCGVAVIASVSCSLASAGWTIQNAAGTVSTSAFTRTSDQTLTDAHGGPLATLPNNFNDMTTASTFITCGDASSASTYANYQATPTSIRLDGSGSALVVNAGGALSGGAAAVSELRVKFVVDAPTFWSFRVGWTTVMGSGTSHFALRRAGSRVNIFDSTTGDWLNERGVLKPGAYELIAHASGESNLDLGTTVPGEPIFVWVNNSGSFNVMIDLCDTGLDSPPADFNLDGFVDFTDFDDFVAAFEMGDASTDFNADGFLDFTDVDGFVAAFEAASGG